MIIINIMGGLGNQFFTYATAYALAKKYNEDVALDLQLYQTTYSLRKCQLEEYSIDFTKKIIPYSFGHNRVAVKIYRIIHDMILKYKYKVDYVDEIEHFSFQDIKVEPGVNVCLRGYWQNHRYFDDVKNDLIRQFKPKFISTEAQNAISKVENKGTVAVHIRRTDYKTYKGGKCLSIDYYIHAMSLMKERLDYSPNFIVFTDDVSFCKQMFSEMLNVSYICNIANLSDMEELYVMSHCDNFILANSSFSWWAAYLSAKDNKVVIAPVVDFWKEDFYLPEWNKIKAVLE